MTVRELNGHMAHSVTYGPDGEVLSFTVQEPRFTPQERAILIASRRRRVGPHGILMSEATNPANQFAFRVPDPEMDWAQKKLSDTQEAYKKAHPNVDMSPLLWRVEKI